MRQLTTFLHKESLGVIFPSYFNPLPFGLIALELTAVSTYLLMVILVY